MLQFLGPNGIQHFPTFWAQKLQKSCNFWAQKLQLCSRDSLFDVLSFICVSIHIFILPIEIYGLYEMVEFFVFMWYLCKVQN